MQDTALYESILGLTAPWHVVDVKLDTEAQKVEVWVENSEKSLRCPTCGAKSLRYDARPRRWRHLDTCQFQTILCASVPRVRCREHGVRQVRIPWAERGSKFTALFEARVIRWLEEASISAVADLFGLDWGTVDRIMGRAVRRGLKRKSFEQGHKLPARLGIDETSFQKRHEYVTVICDQDSGDVVHVGDGRSAEAVSEYLKPFDLEARGAVETVAMDMWQAYITSVTEWIPDAERKICFDKFHVAQHLSKAVDQVRRQENKQLIAEGEDALKKTRYLWLMNTDELSEEARRRFEQVQRIATKTARAWAIKEAGMEVWRYRSRFWARKALEAWYDWAIRSRLAPIKKVARMLKRRLAGVINAMHHGITNARSESINARIKWVKFSARGFRNRDRFRRAIYFHLGGLDFTLEVHQPIVAHTT